MSYNNYDGLRDTLISIEAQTAEHTLFEVVVVDGGSTDDSSELLKSSVLQNVRFVSEVDDGIFDAQNKGASMAVGDYYLFLNAGDVLAGPDAVSLLLTGISVGPAWLLAGCLDLQGGQDSRKFDHSPSWWLHALGIKAYCQQSIAYSRRLFELLGGFDYEAAGLAADYDFNLRAGLVAKPHQLEDVVVLYEGAGISSTPSFQKDIPRMFHAVRVERFQLSGVARAADYLFYILYMAKKQLWFRIKRKRTTTVTYRSN